MLKNNSQGVYCYNYSDPYLWNNTIQGILNSSTGVDVYYDSNVNLLTSSITAGHNVITNCYIGLRTNYHCFGGLSAARVQGQNSVYANGMHNVEAITYSSVTAKSNYWGTTFPPPDSWFSAVDNSSIDHSSPLQNDPNPGRLGKVAGSNLSLDGPLANVGTADSSEDLAMRRFADGRYNEAIPLFLDVFNLDPASLRSKSMLLWLSESFEKAGRTDFVSYLQTQIVPKSQVDADLSVMVRELEAHWLKTTGKYQDALARYQTLRKDFPDNKNIDKNALFNIGEIQLIGLQDRASASATFDLLNTTYPSDPVFQISRSLLSIGSGFNLSVSKAEASGSIVMQDKVTSFALDPVYPNPFNPSTTIRYGLPEAANVSLIVYDVLGRELAVLAKGSFEAGYHTATWGSTTLASGVYFARLTVSDQLGRILYNKVNKLLLTK